MLAVALAACTDSRLRGAAEMGPLVEAPQAAAPTGATLGTGSVKVALILPLTGTGQGAMAGQSLRNAADLALSEFQGADLTVLVKDDKGTAEGARASAASSGLSAA